jgi:hypothetical protein
METETTLQRGDFAVIVANNCRPAHFYPVGTVVYICAEGDLGSDSLLVVNHNGLTQFVKPRNLEKLDNPPQGVDAIKFYKHIKE